MSMMLGLMELNLLLVLLTAGGGPVMGPAHAAATAVVAIRANVGPVEAKVEAPGDVALVQLTEVDGLAAKGRALACRTGDTWQSGPACAAAVPPGAELRVFTGHAGVVGGLRVEAVRPDPEGGAVAVEGRLTAPIPALDDGDALRTPFAIHGAARHLVEPPATEGYDDGQLSALLELGKRAARMNRRMAEGMRPTQYAVAPLSPGHRGAVLVAATTYPEGDLASAPKPSASLLFAHDPERSGGEWARFVVAQVMSRPDDARAFERYQVAAVLDVDGDAERELLVRGRSKLGDRFRLFRLRGDELRFDPLGDWAGVEMAAGAPAAKKR